MNTKQADRIELGHINRVREMAIESLSPEGYESLNRILDVLSKTRGLDNPNLKQGV